MRPIVRITLIAISALCMSSAAYAAQFGIETSDSRIGFEAEQAGETFTGYFPDYDAAITFDPNHLDDSHIALTIRVAKTRVEGEDRQNAITGTEWLDVTRFATASFKSDDIEKQDDGSFIAEGTLTIKGVKKQVEIPFTLTPRGHDYIAKGRFTIHRRDFFLGTGTWEKDMWVAYPVTVFFDLLCVRQSSTSNQDGD